MLTRRGRYALGATLFLILGGCSLDTFNLNLLGTTARRETVLNGSLETTSRATSKALTDMGLFVSTSRDADKVELTGVTKQGHRFTLDLRRNRTEGAETTIIAVRWEKEPDDAFWLALLQATSQVQFSRSGV